MHSPNYGVRIWSSLFVILAFGLMAGNAIASIYLCGVKVYIQEVDNTPLGVCTIIMGALLYGLVGVSYFMTVSTNPGIIHNYQPPNDMSLLDRTVREWLPGFSQYCPSCRRYRPERAHHCSTCGACVALRDHHCPWTGGCIGRGNLKSFILTLFYISCGGTLMFAIELKAFIHVIQDDQALGVLQMPFILHAALLGCLGFAVGVLCINMVHGVFMNRTAVEYCYSTPNPYDLGKRKNFELVFGHDPALWCIPTTSPRDEATEKRCCV